EVKVSREEFDWLCSSPGVDGNAVIDRIWKRGAQLLLITDGDHPLCWHTRKDAGQVPAFRVQVQDTTAAGDAFVGGFLYKLANRLTSGSGLDAFCRDRLAIEE